MILKQSTISKVLPVLLIATSIGAVLVTALLKLERLVAAQDYLDPSFCALSNGSIVYSIRDRGGGVLVRYDRLNKSRQVIARTPYLETDLSASTDGRFIAYRYKFPGSSFGGIGEINVATGAAETFFQGQFAGYGAPVASPDGSHVLYKHWGSNAGGLSNEMGVLSEVDVKTGAVYDIVPDGKFLSIQSPIYVDANRIIFAGDGRSDDKGASGRGKKRGQTPRLQMQFATDRAKGGVKFTVCERTQLAD